MAIQVFTLSANNGKCIYLLTCDTVIDMGILNFKKLLKVLDLNEDNEIQLENLFNYNLKFKNGKYVNNYILDYMKNKYYKEF